MFCRYFKFVLGKLIAHIKKAYQVRTASIGNISGQMFLSSALLGSVHTSDFTADQSWPSYLDFHSFFQYSGIII